ncbi:MAG: ABC transporter ATP-binding protein [Phycisphaerales bacterium]
MSVSEDGTAGGGGGQGGRSDTPLTPRSSRARYREYLLKARGLKALTGEDAGKEIDPNHPSRTKRKRTFGVLLREFWALLGARERGGLGGRARVIACIGTVTVAALTGLLMPAATKVVLDYVLTDNPGPAGLPEWVDRVVPGRDRMSLMWAVGVALMVVNLVSIGVGLWGRWHMTRLTKRMQMHIRRRVFDHAVRLPLQRVYQIKSGGAASILREDAGQAAELLFSLLYNPWRAVVQLAGTLVVLASVDWLLLAGALCIIPAAWFSQRTWIARIRPVFREVRNTRTMIDAHATESFGGMRIVRGFARERGEAARFIRNNHLLAREELLAWVWSRFIEAVWMVLLPAGSVAVLLYGGWRVIEGTLTIGDVMMFSAYLLMLLGPLEALTVSATSIQAELAGLDRVLDLLEEPTEFQDQAQSRAARRDGPVGSTLSGPSTQREGIELDRERVLGRITIAGLSFKYPGAAEFVLRGIDLDVPAGRTVALVGPSGAGKTTLCNLVARFYDPTKGSIALDGVDLRRIDVHSYRSLLGIVEQDVFLFDGTVRENIAYARRGAGEAELVAAARAANADGFIRKLERGYDTLIGERGVRLSGGQKQRIAIARAILADPRILILDEATSNLDSESEALIQESLRKLMRGRTCFVIAHRLSTIRNADLIVVLENAGDGGRIVESGTHAELAARSGRYWAMLRRQVEPGQEPEPAAANGAG